MKPTLFPFLCFQNISFIKLSIVISKSMQELYDMFAYEVDYEKYPDIKQKYRFARIRFIDSDKYDVIDE